MKILALDTSSAFSSIAIAQDGNIIASRSFDAPRGRGAEIFAILEEMRPLWFGLDCLAIGIGPGTYNGLRVACAIASSFHLALNIPIITAPSICALDVSASHYFACGDARGGRFFCAEVVDHSLRGEIQLLDPSAFDSLISLSRPIPIFRIGAIHHYDFLPLATPSAEALALLAPSLSPVAPDSITPIYLKPPHITLPKPRQS